MGVGSAGAMVDVSSYVEFEEEVTRSYGRHDEFRDTSGGTFSFTLDNHDGRFTPGNTSSPLLTTLSEGMQVSWLLGTRLLQGSVRSIQPAFPGDQSSWAQVQITCDDMLASAARRDLDVLEDALDQVATVYAQWPMNDAAGSTIAAERSSSGIGDLSLTRFSATPATPVPLLFGTASVPGISTTQLRLEANTEILHLASGNASPSFPYPQTSMGTWGFWATAAQNTQLTFEVLFAGLTRSVQVQYLQGPTQSVIIMTLGTNVVTGYFLPLSEQHKAHYIAIQLGTTFAAGVWTVTGTLYVDGVSQASGNYAQPGSVTSLNTADRQPTMIQFIIGDGGTDNFATISRLSHTLTLPREELVTNPTEARILTAIAAAVPEITLDTLPSDLSPSAVLPPTGRGSALDAMNDVLRTEQGYAISTATGTLLAPVQKVSIRARQRSTAVDQSFNAERELASAPTFVRDITNLVSSETVNGPEYSVTVADPAAVARVGSASGSDDTLFVYKSDLTAWGQDRINRGENLNLRVASVTIDAMTTPTDRSSALLGLTLGDCVQITNLPTTQLGFSTWSGWLIGGSESHQVDGHRFTFYFAPILPYSPALFDTARFADSGADQTFADAGSLYATTSLTSGATSFGIAQQGLVTNPNLERTNMGYVFQIDNEQMIVTAAAAYSAGAQVVTVTRGANGTTAAAHIAFARVRTVNPARFIF